MTTEIFQATAAGCAINLNYKNSGVCSSRVGGKGFFIDNSRTGRYVRGIL